MRNILLVAAFLVSATSGAMAGCRPIPGQTGFLCDSSIIPPPLLAQATMSATTSSTAVSAANVTVTGGTVPTGPTVVRIKVSPAATANVSVCWFGGTCTVSSGDPMVPGETHTIFLPAYASAPPTVISASSSQPIEVEWQ